MNLAQLIYQALHNPQLRQALENGTLSAEELHMSAREVAAAAEALRLGEHLLGGGRRNPFSALSEPLNGWGSGTVPSRMLDNPAS